jgi:tetratricopeptide (TPR) repeat protein
MLSSNRELEKAIRLLEETPDANLKQVRALQAFEKSLSYMSAHQYELCSEGFQRCVKLNNWSHGLYYFLAGAAYVERYRELKSVDADKAQAAKAKATELLKATPEHVGKRKMMGRQLPFDAFVSRKIQKWEQRAKEWNCDFIDAVGVAPMEEMIYFWNGYKRMRSEHLEVSMKKLDWSTSEANPYWSKESLDEQAILKLLRAVVLRNLDRREEARLVLQEVLAHQWHEFKGGLKDNWTLPVAHYEMAVTYWKDYCEDGNTTSLNEAKKWLDKASGWEAYDLDAR